MHGSMQRIGQFQSLNPLPTHPLQAAEMSNEEIKERCEAIYKQNTENRKELERLRGLCNHESSHEGLYDFGGGKIFPYSICDYCNEPLEMVYRPIEDFIQKLA